MPSFAPQFIFFLFARIVDRTNNKEQVHAVFVLNYKLFDIKYDTLRVKTSSFCTFGSISVAISFLFHRFHSTRRRHRHLFFFSPVFFVFCLHRCQESSYFYYHLCYLYYRLRFHCDITFEQFASVVSGWSFFFRANNWNKVENIHTQMQEDERTRQTGECVTKSKRKSIRFIVRFCVDFFLFGRMFGATFISSANVLAVACFAGAIESHRFGCMTFFLVLLCCSNHPIETKRKYRISFLLCALFFSFFFFDFGDNIHSLVSLSKGCMQSIWDDIALSLRDWRTTQNIREEHWNQ